MDKVENINEGITYGVTSLLYNPTVKTIVTLILALYAGGAAPALPNFVIRFFDSIIGRMIFTFLISGMPVPLSNILIII